MIIAGLGCKKGSLIEDVLATLHMACTAYSVELSDVKALTTGEIKAQESSFIDVARELNIPLFIISNKDLLSVSDRLLTHSEHSLKISGSPCLSEAAALFHAGKQGQLMGARMTYHHVTCALAKDGVQ